MGRERMWAMALASLLLGAQSPEMFGGASIHGVAPVGPGLYQDLHGHLGAGIGLFMGATFGESHALRGTVDFTGQFVTAWETPARRGGSQTFHDIWRSLRLGGEYLFWPRGTEGTPYVLLGAGMQEAWVNRTEGSLLCATLIVLSASQGGNPQGLPESLRVKGTALDHWAPYCTVGVGWPFKENVQMELRIIGGSYARYPQAGFSTRSEEAVSRRKGYRLVWSLSFASLR